jgi:type IV fimbrial biogenesis protein FimT
MNILSNRRFKGAGFTMMEMVVVMTIVGILTAIAVPSFKYLTNSNRLSGQLNGLLGDMQYARSESIKEGLPITVCASAAPLTQCSASNDWSTGWIVFVDTNANQTVDAGVDNILRTQNALSGGSTLTGDNTFKAITFNREGFAKTNVAGTVTMALHAPVPSPASTRCLLVTPFGMLSTVKYAAGVCL